MTRECHQMVLSNSASTGIPVFLLFFFFRYTYTCTFHIVHARTVEHGVHHCSGVWLSCMLYANVCRDWIFFYSGMHVCVLYVSDVFTDTCRLSFKLESALTARHRERSMSGPSLLSFEALWTASKTRWAGQCVETLANIMNVCTAP